MKTWISVLLLTGAVLVGMLGTPLVCLGQDAALLQKARSGDALAQFQLGRMYAEGKGVKQDEVEAVTWYRQAAESGNPSAQIELSGRHMQGLGVRRDRVLAHVWLNLSQTTGGNPKDSPRWRDLSLDQLEGKMTAEQISSAEQIARDWRPGADPRSVSGSYSNSRDFEPDTTAKESTIPTHWTGIQSAQGITWSVDLKILNRTVGACCAEIAYPSLNCSGYWTCKPGTTSSLIIAKEKITSGRWSCVDGVDVRVDLSSDSAILSSRTASLSTAGELKPRKTNDPANPLPSQISRTTCSTDIVTQSKSGNRNRRNTWHGRKHQRRVSEKKVAITSPTSAQPPVVLQDQSPKGSPQKSVSGSGTSRGLDTDPPIIHVTKNLEADETQGTINLSGSIEDDSSIELFSIDGHEIELSESGTFNFPRYIRSGDVKDFVVVAIDSFGNRSVETVVASRGMKPPIEKVEFEPLDPNRSKKGRRKNPAAALVIGVEDYKRMPGALHARTDAEVFYDYASRALGIPAGRIILLVDSEADNIGIQDAVRRLGGLADGKTDLYVYFAGHGFASGKGAPYLLPHDGDARYLGQLVSRDDVFESLAALKARSVTVFLDTCYSGRGREGTQLAKGMRPLVIASSKKEVPEGFTVISAAASDEWSGDLPEAEHGLFSYYLMQGLGGEADADGDRAITVEELHGYVAENVGRQAARLGREQSPELFGERERVVVRY